MVKTINPLQIGGNIKFSPSSGPDLTAGVSDLAKLSPAWVIVIGLSVVAYGIYLLAKKENNS